MKRPFAVTMLVLLLVAAVAACRDREEPKINVDQISNVDDTAATNTATDANDRGTFPSTTDTARTDAVTLTTTTGTITDTSMTTATTTITATVP